LRPADPVQQMSKYLTEEDCPRLYVTTVLHPHPSFQVSQQVYIKNMLYKCTFLLWFNFALLLHNLLLMQLYLKAFFYQRFFSEPMEAIKGNNFYLTVPV
jgi:hypothetical protein